MAKSKGTSQPLAIELLMSDHRKVEDLFGEYESAKESEDEGRLAIAATICAELTVHAQVEEELFYPWLRENLGQEEMEMVEEAEVEHQSAKDLIAQLEAATSVDAVFDAKVKVQSEYIKHHVKEEEEEIVPEVSDKKEELDELGQTMAARKAELSQDGITPPPAAREGSQKKKQENGAGRTR